MPWTHQPEEPGVASQEVKKWTLQPCLEEVTYPEGDICKEDAEEEGREIYAKLSVTRAIKRDI